MFVLQSKTITGNVKQPTADDVRETVEIALKKKAMNTKLHFRWFVHCD